MLKHTGGEQVKAGFYWHPREWKGTVIPPEGGVLPGDGGARYYRLPLPLLLVLAPIMGGAFAMFLPFIGLAMLAMFLTGRLRSKRTEKDAAADKTTRAA